MIEVGDHVTVGKTGDTHWVVQDIEPNGWAWLRSGVTGVHWYKRLASLPLFKKGNV